MNAFTDTRRVQAKAGRNLANHTSQAKRMKAGLHVANCIQFHWSVKWSDRSIYMFNTVDKISKLFRRFLEERRRIGDILLEIGETTR